MQGIYSYALNLPYWQGLILYLLAITYPFLALLVLIPSHAKVFLFVPLAWLWAKSWDIGFALVMIVDKVLYTLLPHVDSVYNPAGNTEYLNTIVNGMRANSMYGIVEGGQIDPLYGMNMHFQILALVLYSIPAISGYLIMKGKSSVLATFSGGAQQASETASSYAKSRFYALRQSELIMNSQNNEALAYGLAGRLGEDLFSHGRGKDALLWVRLVPEEALPASFWGLQHKAVHDKGHLVPFQAESKAVLT